MERYRAFYDISVTLGSESADYPGDPPFSRKLICAIADKDSFDLSALEMSAHVGTHIDVPAHFISEGKTIEQYEARHFILPAQIADIPDTDLIRPAHLKDTDIQNGAALLFRTDNSISGRSVSGVFSEDFVALAPETADLCVEKGVPLVGIDYISVEKFDDETFPVHRKLLGHGVLILEGLNLRDVPPGKYTLCCLPLKIGGGEASPVRAVLWC